MYWTVWDEGVGVDYSIGNPSFTVLDGVLSGITMIR